MFITTYKSSDTKNTQQIQSTLQFFLEEMLGWYDADKNAGKKDTGGNFKPADINGQNFVTKGPYYYSSDFRMLSGSKANVINEIKSRASDFTADNFKSINGATLNNLFKTFGFTQIQGTGLIGAATVKYLSSTQLNALDSAYFGAIFDIGWLKKPSDFFGVDVIAGLG